MEAENKRRKRTSSEMTDEKRRVEKLLLEDLRRRDSGMNLKVPGERALAERYGASLRVIRGVLENLRNHRMLVTAPRVAARICAPLRPLAGKRFAFAAFMERSRPEHLFNQASLVCAGLEAQLAAEGAVLELINCWTPEFRPGDTVFPHVERRLAEEEFDAALICLESGYRTFATPAGMLKIDVGAESAGTSFSVNFDHGQCGAAAAAHLLEYGHRTIAMAVLPAFSWSVARRDGAAREVARVPGARLLEFRLETYGNPMPDWSELERMAAAVAATDVTAVIAPNDLFATRLIEFFQRLGKPVPGALSMVGFDDSWRYRPWNLTTVQLSDAELGRAAFGLLRDLFVHPETRCEPRRLRTTCPLLIRSTTKKLNHNPMESQK